MSSDSARNRVPTKFNKNERTHIETIERRLAYLLDDAAAHDPTTYAAAEARALGWALDVLNNTIDTADMRLWHLEQQMRRALSRIGRIEHELTVDDESEDV